VPLRYRESSPMPCNACVLAPRRLPGGVRNAAHGELATAARDQAALFFCLVRRSRHCPAAFHRFFELPAASGCQSWFLISLCSPASPFFPLCCRSPSSQSIKSSTSDPGTQQAMHRLAREFASKVDDVRDHIRIAMSARTFRPLVPEL